MTINIEKSNNQKTIMKWCICVILGLLPLLVPLSETYTVQMQRFLIITVFGIAILAFELMNNFAVAIMLPTLWLLAGVCNYATAFSSWTNSTSMMMIGSMVLVAVYQKIGLLNRIGYWCIVRAGGTFTGIIWGLYFASLAIMLLGFSMPMILTYAFAYTLYKALGLKPSDRESIIIVLVTILGGVQSATYLYCPLTMSLLNTSAQSVMPEINIAWYQLIFYNCPTFFVSTLLVWATLKWYKIKIKNQGISGEKGKEHFQDAYRKLGAISSAEKKGSIILILIAAFLFTQPFHNLDAAYAFMIAVVLFFVPGINIGDNETVKNVPWDNIFLIMAFLAVGSVGTQLGLNNIISNGLVPIISAMGPYWSVLGTFIMATVSNFILSPFAMLAVLPAPIAQYCIDAGFDFLPHLYALYQAKDMVFLPYEYPTYLVLFAFGMVKMGDMIKICTVKSLVMLATFLVIFMPFWHFMGLM